MCIHIWLWKNEFVDTKNVVGNFFKEKGKHQELTYFDNDEDKNVIVNRDGNLENVDPRNIYYMTESDAKDFYSDVLKNPYLMENHHSMILMMYLLLKKWTI